MRLVLAFLLAAASVTASPQAVTQKQPDVIFVPTPQEGVDAMLKLANVHEGDVLYDLGSGDGRIPVAAAKRYGVGAPGIGTDPQRIPAGNENAQKKGVPH